MLQHTLSFTQFGILRKDDFFEVVLDPGPDKLEKWILSSAPSKRSTGVTLAQPCRIGTTKLNHSIGWLGERQFGVGKGGASVATYPLGRTRFGCSLAGKACPELVEGSARATQPIPIRECFWCR